jgi:hypothetical protein
MCVEPDSSRLVRVPDQLLRMCCIHQTRKERRRLPAVQAASAYLPRPHDAAPPAPAASAPAPAVDPLFAELGRAPAIVLPG